MIAGDKEYTLSYYPDGRALAVAPTPTANRPEVPVATGIIPTDLLSKATQVEIEPGQHEGRSCKRVTLRLGAIDAIYYADPEIGYRYHAVEFRSKEGRLLRTKHLSDYRVVNGILFPHVEVERKLTAEGIPSQEATFRTQDVCLNESIPESEWSIRLPQGTSASVFTGPNKKIFKLADEMTLKFETARSLGN